jgi:hypothetical protein
MDNFKYVAWEVLPGEGVYFPMMEDENGDLFTTGPSIEKSLGLTKTIMTKIYRNNKKEFDALRVPIRHPKDFIKEHKNLFGIKRVRTDLNIWSADDILTFAFHAKSEKSVEFRISLRKFIKEHSKKHYVTREQYEELLEQKDYYQEKFEKLSIVALTEWMPAVKITGTSAGKSLAAQKKLKSLLGDYGLLN